jgi:hypothetical protein
VLLFAAAVSYGVLEVHPENDTWIGLAAGRQILAADEFPLTDTFSYTAAGRVWYNQNWLTHAAQYWLYDTIAPDAVIYATWALAGSAFVLTLLASYWRSGTWPGALVAAAVVALGCRDFVSARPATTGFFCLAGVWALLCAVEGQRQRPRWWPIAPLLPLMLVWGHAHGSFVLGYGVLGLYILHWVGLRALRRPTAADGRQVAALAVTLAAAVALTVVLGPFGVDNFVHGEKVAGSAIWRDVAEWQPPYVLGENFPPVWRFWTILAGSVAVLAACALLRLLAAGPARPVEAGGHPHVTVFDVVMLAVGLGMTLWARRFAPVFFILGAPTVLAAVVLLLRPVRVSRQRGPAVSFSALAGICGIAVGVVTASKARADLVAQYADDHDFGLLERVTVYDIAPHDAFIFIKENDLHLNLLAEWSLAGLVMLHAPSAKVFVDGRAQQVYDENRYRQYHALFVADDTPRPVMFRILDESGTDAVLLRIWDRGANLLPALDESPDWVPVLVDPDYRLFLRLGSRGLERLGELLRSGAASWPEKPTSLAGQAFVWRSTTPPDLERAVSSWDRALRRTPALGAVCFRPMIAALLEAGRDGEARRRVEAYASVLKHPAAGLSEQRRSELRQILEECRADIEAAAPGDVSPD